LTEGREEKSQCHGYSVRDHDSSARDISKRHEGQSKQRKREIGHNKEFWILSLTESGFPVF